MSRQNGNWPIFFSVIVPFSMENQSNDVCCWPKGGWPKPKLWPFSIKRGETLSSASLKHERIYIGNIQQLNSLFFRVAVGLFYLRGVGFAWLYVGPLCKQFPHFFPKNQEIFQISHPSKHKPDLPSIPPNILCQNIPTHPIPRWSSPVATPWWIWRSTGSGSPTAPELWSCLRESPRRIIPTMAMRSSTWTSVPWGGEILRTTND